MRVLIAPDKFKGTLTAPAAARAIARGWKRARPQDQLELLPMSDGGDGFGAIIGKLIHSRQMICRTVDAAHRTHRARWWWQAPDRIAIIESAEVIGLANLPKGKFHPFDLDTTGLVRLFMAAQRRGARKIIVGVGGSATNDAGFGLARALGWRFLDRCGRAITRWTRLDELSKIIRPAFRADGEIMVAVDVTNRLLGTTGCTRIYGPQKGLRPIDFPKAESCLRRLARVVGAKYANEPGAGAAGGLGFGLAAFLDARIVSGFDLFARHARISEKLEKVDLVITGEGSMDRSTRMGKGVGQLVAWCQRAGTPCLGLAGVVTPETRNWRALLGVAGITDFFGKPHAERHAAVCLATLAKRASGLFEESGV